MNHQPFENWLLSEDPLPEDDERALRDHLADCDQCNELEDAWLNVSNLFTDVPAVGPAPDPGHHPCQLSPNRLNRSIFSATSA